MLTKEIYYFMESCLFIIFLPKAIISFFALLYSFSVGLSLAP